MKALSLIGTAAAIIVLGAASSRATEDGGARSRSQPCDIVGTWTMVDYLYDDSNRYTDAALTLLFFNETHWVQVSEVIKDPPQPSLLTLGGPYTIVGDSLYRTEDLGRPNDSGRTWAFWCRSDGDVLQLNSYELGHSYEFTYERVVSEESRNAP